MSISHIGSTINGTYYVEELRSFGTDPVVYFAGGVNSARYGWGNGWQHFINLKFSNSPVYRVSWPSTVFQNTARGNSRWPKWFDVHRFLRATQNTPSWRAVEAGRFLADHLITQNRPVVLFGHSMGAYLIANAARKLANTSGLRPNILEIHLTGAAIVNNPVWHELSGLTQNGIYNYYYRYDSVLRNLFSPSEGARWSDIVGLNGFQLHDSNIFDVDVTDEMGRYMVQENLQPPKDHDAYRSVVVLQGTAYNNVYSQLSLVS